MRTEPCPVELKRRVMRRYCLHGNRNFREVIVRLSPKNRSVLFIQLPDGTIVLAVKKC